MQKIRRFMETNKGRISLTGGNGQFNVSGTIHGKKVFMSTNKFEKAKEQYFKWSRLLRWQRNPWV